MPSHAEDVFDALNSCERDVLLRLLQREIQFLVIGGLAVRFHGYLREIRDLDVLINRSPDNLNKVVELLSGLGFNVTDPRMLLLPEKKIHLAYYDLCLVTSMRDMDPYDILFSRRASAQFEGYEVPFLSRLDLLQAKRLAMNDSERGERREDDGTDLRMLVNS